MRRGSARYGRDGNMAQAAREIKRAVPIGASAVETPLIESLFQIFVGDVDDDRLIGL